MRNSKLLVLVALMTSTQAFAQTVTDYHTTVNDKVIEWVDVKNETGEIAFSGYSFGGAVAVSCHNPQNGDKELVEQYLQDAQANKTPLSAKLHYQDGAAACIEFMDQDQLLAELREAKAEELVEEVADVNDEVSEVEVILDAETLEVVDSERSVTEEVTTEESSEEEVETSEVIQE